MTTGKREDRPAPAAAAETAETPALEGLTAGVRLLLAAALAAAVAWVLLPALGGDFVYDDLTLVQRNPWITSLGRALSAWDEPLWGFESERYAGQVGFWRPLTVLALAAGRALGSGEPWGHHLVSAAALLLACLAAWRLVSQLTGCAWTGWAAALLFACHPMTTQAGAWIAAVNDPLAAALVLAALAARRRWQEGGSRQGAPVGSGLLFLLALLTKEQALVLLPGALLLDLLWKRGLRPGATGPRSWLPVAGALVLWWLLRWRVFGEPSGGLGGALVDLGLSAGRTWELRAEALGAWIAGAILPFEGQPFFRAVRPVADWSEPAARLALLALVGWAAALAAALGLGRRGAALALAAMPVAVLPVLVDPERAGAFPIADRYALLLVLAACALAAAGLLRRLPRGAALGLAVVAATGMSTAARDRAALYEDNLTFHRAATLESPDVAPAWWGLGRELLMRYQVSAETGLVDEAMAAFLKTLALGHDYGERQPRLTADAPVPERLAELLPLINDTSAKPRPDPRVMVSGFDRLQGNLGQAWCYLLSAAISPDPDFETPEAVFKAVAQAMPNESEPRVGLGATLLAQGDLAGAERELREATRLDARNAEAWFNLGSTLSRAGKHDEAIQAYREAVALRPDRRSQVRLVSTAIDAGRLDEAARLLGELRTAAPRDPELAYLEGVRALSARDLTRALEWFDRAIAVEPDMGEAHRYRGTVLAQQGQRSAAIDALGRACELLPESFDAHYRTAQLLLAEPATAASARPYLEVAYKRSPPGELRAALAEFMAQFAGADPDALMGLAALEQARGDWPAALRWTERVLGNPAAWQGRPGREGSLAKVHELRGILFERLERAAEAQVEYEAALALDSTAFWPQHNLGILLVKLGRPDLARPLIAGALENLDALGRADDPESLRSAAESTLRGVLAAIDRGEAEFMGPRPELPQAPRDR